MDILNELLELYDRANHDEKIFRDRNNTTLRDNYLFENSNYYSDIKKELIYSNKCHNLEEQLGCPLDVFVNATINGIIVDGECFSVKIYKDNNGYYFALSNGSAFPFYLSSYQKTWCLKEDRR